MRSLCFANGPAGQARVPVLLTTTAQAGTGSGLSRRHGEGMAVAEQEIAARLKPGQIAPGLWSREEIARRLPRWKADASAWAEDCVWIERPDGTVGPIELYPDQQRALREGSSCRQHPGGILEPIRKTVVFCRPKRNHKSLDAAILAAHSVALFPRRKSYVVANSERQAHSVTFDYVIQIFRRSPMLRNHAKYGSAWLNDTIVELPQNTTEITIPSLESRIIAMPCNWATVQGVPVTGVLVVEELHAAVNESIFSMLAGQTEALTARTVIASQAGSRNGVLFRLYKQAQNQGGNNPRIWFDYWTNNRAPWITEEWLADREAALPPWEFQYLHCNAWGTGGQRFLTADLVDRVFEIDYPLIAQRHDLRTPTEIHKGAPEPAFEALDRAAWRELRDRMGWAPCAFGIGLDRAQPYAHQEKTNLAVHLKTAGEVVVRRGRALARPGPGDSVSVDGGRAEARPLLTAQPNGQRAARARPTTASYEIWEIASIDCPNSADDEIEEAIEVVEEIIGQHIDDRRYETYQAADLAIEHGAELISATSPQQVKMFNHMHRLSKEGRYHCSPQSIALKVEFEDFMVNTEQRLTRFEHGSGCTDDRIYGHGHSIEAVTEAVIVTQRFRQKPRGM